MHIVDGIEKLTGYRPFTVIEQYKIEAFEQKKIIDESSAWLIFQRRAQEYFENQEVMVSPGQKRRYIIDRIHPSIRIGRLDVDKEESAETMGVQRFRTCIRHINRKLFPIPNGGIYQHRAEEIALVTLLSVQPSLS